MNKRRPSPKSGYGSRPAGIQQMARAAGALLLGVASNALGAPGKIVLIGGPNRNGVAEGEFVNGISLFAATLKAAPTFAGCEILAFPNGWPAAEESCQGASTLVLYFDGEQSSPLVGAGPMKQLQQLLGRGAGLVCLNRPWSLPDQSAAAPLRESMGVQTDQPAGALKGQLRCEPAAGHPIASGLALFAYRDEMSVPTLAAPPRVVPLLRATAPDATSALRTVAWAVERSGGGRSFGFAGGRDHRVFSEPPVRKMLLNAIAWTAHLSVPAGGVDTNPGVMGQAVVTRSADLKPLPQPWGELTWYTSADQKNSQTMTTGVAIIKPGQSNPRHFHPNCDEVLHLLQGKIRHTMNDVTVEMSAGDTVSIPTGTLHNATNIGSEDAVMAISFSTAYRQVVGEK